jgi:hypothetical protein
LTKHLKHIEGFQGSLEELAKSIGNMTYDQTALLIEKLADDIKKQADSDLTKGRKKLSKELYSTANELYEARDKMKLAWKICEPYMEDGD